MENGTAMKPMTCGSVYLWIPDPRSTLGGHVTVSRVPLPRLDSWVEGRSRLWGQHVRVRNAGEMNAPLASKTGSRIVPIGNALPNPDGDFIFEP
jgi:hypothetical protein